MNRWKKSRETLSTHSKVGERRNQSRLGWESKGEKYWLDWFEGRSYTLLFVDGNHENFDRLNGYPVKEWHGGKVHELRPHVMHLMRGQVFEIDGKKIFAFGGASSHDITGGILETDDPSFRKKKKMLDRGYEPYRINHLTWWEQELANEEEMEEGRNINDKEILIYEQMIRIS